MTTYIRYIIMYTFKCDDTRTAFRNMVNSSFYTEEINESSYVIMSNDIINDMITQINTIMSQIKRDYAIQYDTDFVSLLYAAKLADITDNINSDKIINYQFNL